jgi:hypothetical protein
MADETWDAFIEEAADAFNPLPEGTYDFIVTGAEGKVSGSGNPMVKVDAKVTTGPHAGKAIKSFYVIRTASQAKKFVLHMKAMGISIEVLTAHKPTMQQLAKAMEGKPFRGKVKHTSDDTYGDAVELSWAMLPPSGGAIAVTSFPALSEGESLGYGSDSGASVATDDDAGF